MRGLANLKGVHGDHGGDRGMAGGIVWLDLVFPSSSGSKNFVHWHGVFRSVACGVG
jgi:hypothetical protein